VDIDIVYVHGYGFPSYRGGPMFYADNLGISRVLEDIRRLHDKHGTLWTPAPLIEKLAAGSSNFAKFST
jgi:3-hydroxyacyl-CoA dehydrogenase